MSKLKSILLSGIGAVAVAAVAIGGTVAYLTSEDEKVNVMTLGEVKIEQIEQERDENGALVDFTDLKPAYPVVGDIAWDEDGLAVNGVDYKVFDDDLKNVVDKIVTVKNTGKSDAFVRTIVAIEAPDGDPNDLIHLNWNTTGVKMGDSVITEIDGVDYYVVEFTYEEKLAPGETSVPSLMQLFLDSSATNEDCAKFGDAWEVKVISQAVQAAGFETADDAFDGATTFAARSLLDAEVALDTAFGELDEPKAIEWFTGMEHSYLFSFDDLKEAGRVGGNYALGADLHITDKSQFFYGSYVTAIYKDMTLDLNGHKIVIDVDMGEVKNAPVLFYVYAEGASLTVVGDGDIIAKNDAFIFFPRKVSEGLYIYGGNYYNIDETSGTKNDINAIVYSQNNNNIHLYGGTYTFKNVSGHCGGFNVYDNAGAEIVLHEGVLLSNSAYYQGSDANEIHLAEGCTLKEVTIDGEVWYQVSK